VIYYFCFLDAILIVIALLYELRKVCLIHYTVTILANPSHIISLVKLFLRRYYLYKVLVLFSKCFRRHLTDPKFNKLITALRTAVEKNEGSLDKEAMSYSDAFDAFRLSLQFWQLQRSHQKSELGRIHMDTAYCIYTHQTSLLKPSSLEYY
jgi:hypothetical protein